MAHLTSTTTCLRTAPGTPDEIQQGPLLRQHTRLDGHDGGNEWNYVDKYMLVDAANAQQHLRVRQLRPATYTCSTSTSGLDSAANHSNLLEMAPPP